MPLVNFSNVDFDQIKTSIKDYLRSNSNFTDYDFEGSNLSAIIDTLAYNTYISSYNANMVSNEVFIDSATLRENVVSLARNIGYIPSQRYHILPESGRINEYLISYHVGIIWGNIGIISKGVYNRRKIRSFKIIIREIRIRPQIIFDGGLNLIKIDVTKIN